MTDNLMEAIRECIRDGLQGLGARRRQGAQQTVQEVSLEESAGYMIRGGHSHTDLH